MTVIVFTAIVICTRTKICYFAASKKCKKRRDSKERTEGKKGDKKGKNHEASGTISRTVRVCVCVCVYVSTLKY